MSVNILAISGQPPIATTNPLYEKGVSRGMITWPLTADFVDHLVQIVQPTRFRSE